MDRISTRSWMVIGMAGLLLFLSYWARWNWGQQSWSPRSSSFSYEMPRPQTLEPGFDLSDRRVERTFKSLPALAQPKVNAADVKKAVAQAAADQKRKAAATAQAKARAQAAARAKSVRAKRHKVEVVDTSRATSGMAMAGADEQTYGGYSPGQIGNTAAGAPTAQDQQEDEDLNLSAGQWRSLLQSAPTQANVARFLKARQAGKIDETTYYQIVRELLIDSAADRQRAALMIVNADLNSRTYEFLVTALEQVPADVKPQVQRALDSYSQATRIGILARVLTSSRNNAVLVAATTQIATAFSEFRKSYQPSSNQGRRLAGAAGLGQFKSLVPALQRVSQGSGSAADQARQLMTDIQNLE